MVYRYFKDFPRRAASGKVLGDKGFNIAKTLKLDGDQRGLASMVFVFFFFLIKSLLQVMVLNVQDLRPWLHRINLN